ncbi:MAG: hypothetical protein ACK5E3_06845 [Planctomycetota bacterium]
MLHSLRCIGLFVLGFALAMHGPSECLGQTRAVPPPSQMPNDSVPDVLRTWIPWVLWDQSDQSAPSTYRNPDERIYYWPSQVEIQADEAKGSWQVQVAVYRESWFPLPGGSEHWPKGVSDAEKELVVIEHNGSPSVKLKPGNHSLKGYWLWNSLPQKLAIPRSYGLLRLHVRNEPIAIPNWDSAGMLWLSRSTLGPDLQKDSYSFDIHRLIQDGSPIWLRTQIDLTATGKSREEELGFVLPEGWQLSFVNSPIPVAIDDSGKLKAQLRAGNWKILIDAFRIEDINELKYPNGVKPAKEAELLAIQAAPDLRTIELQGVVPIDAQTTRFPTNWRNVTVYQWKTANTATILEKNRGMGIEKPNPLSIARVLWLDDDGTAMTYQDILDGEPKQITRLDVATEHQLGVVRIQGERQLITQNPVTGSEGIELRIRKPQIEAVGRTSSVREIPAIGWQTPADNLDVTLYMPPGWRMLAVFGPDRVEGDWLTAWSLLDLFLLLVFSLAVLRLYGWIPGMVAFAAFALTYHEPGSPRWTWFFLLIPLALIRVIGSGKSLAGLYWWKHTATAVLLLNLIPFAAMQIQNAIYPQLEPSNSNIKNRSLFQWMEQTSNTRADQAGDHYTTMELESSIVQAPMQIPQIRSKLDSAPADRNYVQTNQAQVGNFAYDPKTSIQTGVAKPQWLGTAVHCAWDGPVSDTQTIRPVMISCNQHRALTLCRLVLLMLLMGILLEGLGKIWKQSLAITPTARANPSVPSAILLMMMVAVMASTNAERAFAQIPDNDTLSTLRERVKQASDAFPTAADIPEMSIKIQQDNLEMQATIHAASILAVPLPGKGASWFPSTIEIDGQDAQVVRKDDEHLWVLVPDGIHQLKARGRILESAEWSWAFILAPHHLTIDAPQWTWTGVDPEGTPENQIIFVRKEQRLEGQASYDQKNFRSVFLVERRLEIGLVWKVNTSLKRLSQPGKAVSVSVPTLANEQIITPGVASQAGNIEVNFSADQMVFEWHSELPVSPKIQLVAKSAANGSVSNNLVERWLVETSPVWSMQSVGSKPVFDLRKPNLVPEWNPWPGESVELKFQRPAAVPGKLLTIQSLEHSLEVGGRQRKSKLSFEIESSRGGEQSIQIPSEATVSDVRVARRSVPIRRQADEVLINLQPGAQQVLIEWTQEIPIASVVSMPAIQMPQEVANIRSQMLIPSSRWVLWANGPQRGPAVRFWVVLAVSLLAGWVLGSRMESPLATWEWMLLMIGLTQVHIVSSLLIVAWLFSIQFRRRLNPHSIGGFSFNFLQVSNVLLTIVAIGLLIGVVTAGLLGTPRMFIVGNESFEGNLNWFTPRSDRSLPEPWVLSVSIWYYRFLMLLWALWLANSLLQWLKEWWRSLVDITGWMTWERPKSKQCQPAGLPSQVHEPHLGDQKHEK